MKKSTFFILIFLLNINSESYGQIRLETFFKKVSNFVSAKYENGDLRTIKTWSDSNSVIKTKKKKIKQLAYRGKLFTSEGLQIEFSFFASEFIGLNSRKCNGVIVISYSGECKAALLNVSLGLIPKYDLSFDTVNVLPGYNCSNVSVRLHFNNFDKKVNQVLESVDSALTPLLKHEYFDFYFNDVDKQTSTWQKDFETFMQPTSTALALMIKNKKIAEIMKIIQLKNKGYSWSLAEGLWYYNSLQPILTAEQLKIVNSFNGQKGMINFRSVEELGKIYKFNK